MKVLLLLAAAAPLALAQYDYNTASPGSSTSSAAGSATPTASSSGSAPTINVGASGFTFSPDSVTVPVGGQVVFKFAAFSAGHSATQADFSSPCVPAAAGANGTAPFNSGLVSQGGQTFVVTVQSSDPLWFYCGQLGHCQGGMVGVINPPASGNTLDEFKSAAANVAKSSLPSSVQGGVLGGSASGGSTSGSTSATAASSTSKSGAGMLVPGGALFLGGLFAALLR